jgi:hypothetical protein
MMKIHQVVASDEIRREVDPRRGLVARKEKVLQPGHPAAISSPEHGQFECGPDGTFDVPDELGEWLCSLGHGWYRGANPFAVEDQQTPRTLTVA